MDRYQQQGDGRGRGSDPQPSDFRNNASRGSSDQSVGNGRTEWSQDGHEERDSGRRGIIRGKNSSGNKHAHFVEQTEGVNYHLPTHVYDRYTDEMDGSQHNGSPHHGAQYPIDASVDIEQVGTLYIPKSAPDLNRTLMRRRRTSSKRRSSSKRRHDHENLLGLLSDEDNHLLPSLRLQRRTKMKSLKDRRLDMKEEMKYDTEEDYLDAVERSFSQRYQEMKDNNDITPDKLADLIRESTLKRTRRIGDWTRPKKLDRVNRSMREFFSHFKIWVTSFKVIEGKFGTSVMSFFKFIRWLMFLNIFLMVVMFFITTFPFLFLRKDSFPQTVNKTLSVYHTEAVNCSLEYENYSKAIQAQESTFEKVLDFLQGTGWMERTVLFYGHYHNRSYYEKDGEAHGYNMGLAYLLAVGACFFLSFILLVRNSAKTVKATFGMQDSFAGFSNRVFAGWDYAISNKKAAKVKKTNLYVELKDSIAENLRRKQRKDRSANDKATIFFIRFLANCGVLAILGGSLFLVYYTTDKLLQLQEQNLNEVVALIVQYLPYLTITVLNFAIPMIFQKIVLLEDYSHSKALNITLTRSILLRLASLGVLMGSLYRLLVTDAKHGQYCGNDLWNRTLPTLKGNVRCWETYVGQQIYKLVLLDLIVETSIIFFMQLPRRLLYNQYGQTVGLIKKLGPQDFDLPQNVIDIIYCQTLCWLGLFFSPLIPFMTFLKCLIFFYLRKWTLLRNCSQEEQLYRTSRSQSLFMFVLLLSFILAVVPVGYMISSISPSQSCGPFRVYSNAEYVMFDTLSNTIRSWPGVLREIIIFLGTVGFLIPVIIIILLIMYFFWLLGQGYKKQEKMLSEQLKLEAHDKQFLLNRLNEVLAAAEG